MKLFNPYDNFIIRFVPFVFNKLVEVKDEDEEIIINDILNLIKKSKTPYAFKEDYYVKKIIFEPTNDKNRSMKKIWRIKEIRKIKKFKKVKKIWEIKKRNKRNKTHIKSFLCKNEETKGYMLSDSIWEKKLPIVFSKYEKEYIKLMLEDPEARSFLSEELIEKISSALESYDVSHIKDNYIEREIVFQDKDENALRSRLLVITEALRKNKKIEYVYKSPQRKYEDTASPYRLMYSLRERILKLAACPDSSPDRFILMNIDRFESINISETDSDADPDKFYKSQVRRLILEVENDKEKKAAERCMRTFGSYRRKTIYNKTNDVFHIEIDFYLFDKSFLIKDILSLGSAVQVIEVKKPGKENDSFIKDYELDLRGEIINTLRKIYANME